MLTYLQGVVQLCDSSNVLVYKVLLSTYKGYMSLYDFS